MTDEMYCDGSITVMRPLTFSSMISLYLACE